MAAMCTKAEFDREFILTQLPENYEYVLTSWDVMGNRNFYVEGRVVGDLNADKVKQWLEEFYESSGAKAEPLQGLQKVFVFVFVIGYHKAQLHLVWLHHC